MVLAGVGAYMLMLFAKMETELLIIIIGVWFGLMTLIFVLITFLGFQTEEIRDCE
jgi:ABC-type lipoprotein release transport system permease subunit